MQTTASITLRDQPFPLCRRLLRPSFQRSFLLPLLLLLAALLLPGLAAAQSCTPNTTRDWMVSSDPLAQDIHPRDCLTVEQSPPDFRWPEASSSASYTLNLTYPDGHVRSLNAPQNWRNWDEVLLPGTYSWTVSASGSGTSVPRKFIVSASSRVFVMPNISTLYSTVSAKAHPRSLPDATTLATMKSQRLGAINTLLSAVNGRLTQVLPAAGASADDAYNYSKYAQGSLMACVYTAQDSYCNDAIRRIVNLAAWDPAGATAYTKAGMDTAARYLTWTLATGYDWLYPRLSGTQRSQILSTLRARNSAMYNDIIGSRSRLATHPRDSHGFLTLQVVPLVAVLTAGEASEASTWLANSLPLSVNAVSPWGDEEGGFANAAAQGMWDVGELLQGWIQLRYATGIDLGQKPWLRNWGRYVSYFTPPGMTGGTTVFGDGLEWNEKEHQARYTKGYTYFAPSPLGRWHAGLLSGEDSSRIEYLMAPPADFTGLQLFPAGTPNALYLAAIGQVAMHSDLSNLARTSVYFKSSPPPYGAFNHAHADQNSFVVNAGGERLAIESGYYDDYKTAHWYNWYHQTRAKNAITYDGGQGQLFYEQNGRMGYGSITQFATTSGYDIVTGDATQAYGGALSKATRSLVYLRPNLILVYDNLASSTSRQWEWNIHALNQIAAASDNSLTITSGAQKLCVKPLAGPTTRFAQTNAFTSAPTGSHPAQWHGTYASSSRTTTAEFVTLLNVGCTSVTASASKNSSTGAWSIPVGNQTINISAAGIVSVSGGSTGSTSTGSTTTSPTSTTTTTSTTSPTGVTTTTTSTTSGSTTTTSGTTGTVTSAVQLPPVLPTTGTRAVPTFESIGLYWKPSANPGTAGCTLRYQRVGDPVWKDGLNLWYDSRNGECRGSLVQLQPGTLYVAQMGLPGKAPEVQATATTWNQTVPIAKTVTVSSSSQTLAITQGGTATGYVLYTPAAGSPATIDVANKLPYNVTIAAPYVIVRGLTLKGAQNDAIRLLKGAHDVVIEDNDISNWGRFRTTSAEGSLGIDMDSGIHAVCSDLTMERVVIQRNSIHDPRYTANSWSIAHPAGPQGISFEFCGGNHVIRYNEIYGGSSGHYYNDAIGGADNFTTTGFPNYDTDIYGNLLKNTWDDGIESEGGNRNVRIWNNYLDNTCTGIASTVDSVGPLYIFRNVYNRSRQLKQSSLDSDERNVGFKSGSQSTTIGYGRRYIFHNTLLQATQSGATYPLGAGGGIGAAGLSITSTVTRNNIFHIWKSNWPTFGTLGSGNDLGYDLYNGGMNTTETGGIKGTPIYQSGNGWQSESNGLYQLASNSPGYDKGARIPNFNDNFTGAGPDIGAHEAGTPAMLFGLKAGAAALAAAASSTTSGSTSSGSTSGTTSGSTSGTTSGTTTGTSSGTGSTTTSTPTPSTYAGQPYTGTPYAVPGSFEVENFDRGGEGVAYHDTTTGNQGGQYRLSENVDIITSSDAAGGGYLVNNFATGEWLAYTINVSASGNYVIALRASNNLATGTPGFHLELDGVPISGKIAVPKTGDWTVFQWVSAPAVTIAAGKHILKVVSDEQYFNLNTVRFSSAP